MAENAYDPDDKVSWLKLADAWLHMLPTQPKASADIPGWPKATDEDSKAAHCTSHLSGSRPAQDLRSSSAESPRAAADVLLAEQAGA
jgi:hypothetical protein